MSKRFVVIVLDGFGIGAMNDAARERPGDEKANTLRSILSDYPDMKLANLEQLGLMNAFGAESNDMKYCESANFGKSELMHFGADTFMGHQEIMGTLPKRPTMHPFQEKVDEVYQHLKENGHKVEFVVRGNLRYIVCDDYVTVADNLEADLGMCYNVTAPLDYISFEKEYEIAKLVREVVTVGTIIVHASALIVENLGPEKRKTKTIRAVITPVFIPNCIIIATIGNSAKPVTTYVPTSPIAEIKSTGIPVNTALIPPIPVRQINPQSAPKIGASHFFGAAIPMISVARNNNHGFKRFVTNAFPIPTDAIKPTLSPNAIEAISPRCIRPSIYSGITGRIPS